MTSLPAPQSPSDHQGVFTIHLHSSAYASQQRIEGDRAINAAVQVLRRTHRLKDSSAYAMLRQASSDSRRSLVEQARLVLEQARLDEGLGASDLLAG